MWNLVCRLSNFFYFGNPTNYNYSWEWSNLWFPMDVRAHCVSDLIKTTLWYPGVACDRPLCEPLQMLYKAHKLVRGIWISNQHVGVAALNGIAWVFQPPNWYLVLSSPHNSIMSVCIFSIDHSRGDGREEKGTTHGSSMSESSAVNSERSRMLDLTARKMLDIMKMKRVVC